MEEGGGRHQREGGSRRQIGGRRRPTPEGREDAGGGRVKAGGAVPLIDQCRRGNGWFLVVFHGAFDNIYGGI
jgi:hypothetical protein